MWIKNSIREEIQNLFSASKDISNKTIEKSKLNNLPEPVRKYFKYSLHPQNSNISYVRLKHGGKFRLNDKWMDIEGQEYFTIQDPGFIWLGNVPLFLAKDQYFKGKGSLEVRLFSLIRIIDERGGEMNKSEMLRWLGEAPWYPTALLPSKVISWENDTKTSAKVIMKHQGLKAEGIFSFDKEGQPVRFSAKRNKDGRLEDWTGHYHDYKKVDGMMIPFHVDVEWNLEEQDYTYADFTIQEIEYNKPNVYE